MWVSKKSDGEKKDESGSQEADKSAGNFFEWTGKDFKQMAKKFSPDIMISNLENSGWSKTIEQGGKKNGLATILVDPKTGI